jgi:hypothetical protein
MATCSGKWRRVSRRKKRMVSRWKKRTKAWREYQPMKTSMLRWQILRSSNRVFVRHYILGDDEKCCSLAGMGI